jgi:hypothetical protein
MFDTADPLIGTQRVKFDGNRACARCNNKVAVIGDGYELSCAACGAPCGRISQSTVRWLQAVTSKFGTPATPIILRKTSA